LYRAIYTKTDHYCELFGWPDIFKLRYYKKTRGIRKFLILLVKIARYLLVKRTCCFKTEIIMA